VFDGKDIIFLSCTAYDAIKNKENLSLKKNSYSVGVGMPVKERWHSGFLGAGICSWHIPSISQILIIFHSVGIHVFTD
jgi:hypothetical protein